MATIAKNFRVKNGLVVEGTTATVNGNDILTKDQADLDYITSLVGGSADSTATPDTLVLRDGNGDFAANEITAASVVLDGSDLATTLSANDTAAQGYANDAETGAVATAAADATAKADAAEADAITAAAADATTKADAAEADAITAANAYTDGRETAITTAYQTYADQAEADAISTAAADATSKANAAQSAAETTAAADATAKANTAESNANANTDTLIGDGTVDGTAGNTVKDRIDTAVANLVGGAPELLDTLDEIAAAIADDENFSTTVVSDIAQGVVDAKAYTDTRETAITTAYQTYADAAEADAISTAAADATTKADAAEADAITAAAADATTKADAAQAAAEATAAADATSKANTAESNANTYTDGEITTVNGTISALTTDDIAEGTNEYYTTEKAQDAVAAAIAAGTHANITVTYDDNANTISFEAENGVADSTTDDLTEGSSNLYFTDQRAVDALQAVTPVFTEVDVNSIALNVASTVDVATQNTTGTVYSFDSATYTSAKFVVKADTGSHTEVTEVLLTLDSSSNIAITEYALVNTGGSLMEVSATMSGTDVQLQATVVNDNTTVSATGTLIV